MLSSCARIKALISPSLRTPSPGRYSSARQRSKAGAACILLANFAAVVQHPHIGFLRLIIRIDSRRHKRIGGPRLQLPAAEQTGGDHNQNARPGRPFPAAVP